MIGDWRTGRTHLFKDDADRERFLDRLAERVEDYHIRLYLFVCMTNHFHLVFETPETNCSKFMQSLLTAYTVTYNRRHRRHGHLFDGRYKAKLVEGDDYLLALYWQSSARSLMSTRTGFAGVRNSALRAVAARFLIRYAGLSQRDIADLLNVGSGAAICNQLTRLPDKLANDRRLRRQVKQAEERLEETRCLQRVKRGE